MFINDDSNIRSVKLGCSDTINKYSQTLSKKDEDDANVITIISIILNLIREVQIYSNNNICYQRARQKKRPERKVWEQK